MDLKTLFKSEGLYQTIFPSGEKFVWRLLTLKEYRTLRVLREAGEPLFFYESVFNYCYVGNSDALSDYLPAGYAVAIGELIMWLSGDKGLQNEKEEIEIARQSYPGDTTYEYMKRIILMAFSTYTPEIIESWTRVQFLNKFVLAEAILVNKGNYEPLDVKKIMTAEEAKKKNNIDFAKENKQMRDEVGDLNATSLLDQHPDALRQAQAKNQGLERHQLKKLEKAIPRRR